MLWTRLQLFIIWFLPGNWNRNNNNQLLLFHNFWLSTHQLFWNILSLGWWSCIQQWDIWFCLFIYISSYVVVANWWELRIYALSIALLSYLVVNEARLNFLKREEITADGVNICAFKTTTKKKIYIYIYIYIYSLLCINFFLSKFKLIPSLSMISRGYNKNHFQNPARLNLKITAPPLPQTSCWK